MDATDLDAARAALLAERAQLLEEVGETIVAPGQMTYGSQAAAASQVFEQQRDLALRDRVGRPAGAGRRGPGPARRRHDSGRASAAASRSPPARLEALPWAAYCIECQRIVDRGGR